MIPVAFPSPTFWMLLDASLLAGICATCWILTLAFSVPARKFFRTHLKTCSAVMILLLVVASFYVFVQYNYWKIERELEARFAALHVVLEKPTRLGSIDMPAGTRLTLAVSGDLESFKTAEFPRPVSAYNVDVMVVHRMIDIDYDHKTYAVVGNHPRTASLQAVGTPMVDGWICDTADRIEFDLERSGSLPMFSQCRLAAGNQLAGQPIPQGSKVRRSDGTVYTDGLRDNDHWKIHWADNKAMGLFQLPLIRPEVMLDRQRNVLGFNEATLACEVRLGPMTYPPGTLAVTTGPGLREKHPDTWIFSPAKGMAARYEGHADVPSGMSVLQTKGGELITIAPNENLGIIIFDDIRVDGKQPPEPPGAQCS